MKRLTVAIALCGMLSACSTDFETAAPWKEVMVVYGFINPFDTVQYVRISKAFLGEGNALVMAQEPDSIYFADILDVVLERKIANQLLESHPLTKLDSSEIPKNVDGIFSAPYQAVYAYPFSVPNSTTNDASIYTIRITNRVTGNTATASTRIIEKFNVYVPIDITFVGIPNTSNLRLTTTTSARVYGMTLRINYVETDTATLNSVVKSIDWKLGDQTSTLGNTGASLNFAYTRSDFFRLLGDNIPVDHSKTRRILNNRIDWFISAGTEELYTYMQLTNTGSGVTLDKPLYTNIDNGVGLFTSRSKRLVSLPIRTSTIDSLKLNLFTRDLDFE